MIIKITDNMLSYAFLNEKKKKQTSHKYIKNVYLLLWK